MKNTAINTKNKEKALCRAVRIAIPASVALHTLFIQSPLTGAPLGAAYLFWMAYELGRPYRALSPERALSRFSVSLLIAISLFTAAGYALFYFGALTPASSAILFLLLPAAVWYARKNTSPHAPAPAKKIPAPHPVSLILFAAHAAVLALIFALLFQFKTDAALRSPWEAIPASVFLSLFSLASLLLLLALFLPARKKSAPLALVSAMLHTATAASVALVVYTIGYGFDPFVHQAAENALVAHGTLNPKPFLYIGQYALVSLLHFLTFLPVSAIDALLVPLAGSLLLPLAAWRFLSPFISPPLLSAAAFLLVPWNLFIVTVPQNLANIFLAFLSVLGFSLLARPSNSVRANANIKILWALAGVVAFIHPLSGIPALLYALTTTLFVKPLHFPAALPRMARKALTGFSLLAAISAVPVLFLIAARLFPDLSISFTLPSSEFFRIFGTLGWVPGHSLLHLLHLYATNAQILFLAAAAVGIAIFFRSRPSLSLMRHPHILVPLLVLGNLFLLSFFSFSSLFPSEQWEFSRRLWQTALLFLLPFFLAGIAPLFRVPSGRYAAISFFILSALFLTANAYLWYPRVDRLAEKARGFSTSRADLQAVEWIDKDARGEPYIVLANQAVSAAALRTFGFKKYYTPPSCPSSCPPAFFYSIPTGGALYQYYLSFVYESPVRETVQKAAEYAGVSRAYVVLNRYWLDSEKIKQAARLAADKTHEIQNGEVVIFQYSF